MVAEVGGGIWYFDIPLPNTTVFTVHMATYHRTVGVLSAPVYPGGAITSIYRYLSHLSIENGSFISS
jgi:hypothetical protein